MTDNQKKQNSNILISYETSMGHLYADSSMIDTYSSILRSLAKPLKLAYDPDIQRVVICDGDQSNGLEIAFSPLSDQVKGIRQQIAEVYGIQNGIRTQCGSFAYDLNALQQPSSFSTDEFQIYQYNPDTVKVNTVHVLSPSGHIPTEAEVSEIVHRITPLFSNYVGEYGKPVISFDEVTDDSPYLIDLHNQAPSADFHEILALDMNDESIMVMPSLDSKLISNNLLSRGATKFRVFGGPSDNEVLKFLTPVQFQEETKNGSVYTLIVDAREERAVNSLYDRLTSDPLVVGILATVIGTVIAERLESFLKRKPKKTHR